jgi:hypothetical protein
MRLSPNSRARREAMARIKTRAIEDAQLAIRGNYDAPAYVLKRLGRGDLAAYLSQRKEQKNAE